MSSLSGKLCVITGGAGSIGLACARLFVEHGADVVLADRDTDRLRVAATSLQGLRAGAQVMTCVADVSKRADVTCLLAQACGQHKTIDVLLSNAGNLGTIAPIAEYPEDVFDEVMATHVRGAFLMCKHGLARMSNGGSIIITSSVAGVRGDAGVYGYITAKHAQVGLMRAVAKEAAARGVRVNTLHPGPVDNDFQATVEAQLTPVLQRDATAFFDGLIPLGRHARPEEIANAALFLASDQSSFVTGSTLMVDGGMSA